MGNTPCHVFNCRAAARLAGFGGGIGGAFGIGGGGF
jgi:hypothetical protein